MTDPRTTSDGDDTEDDSVRGVDLPEDSLFTLDEYLDMYKVASSEPAFKILCTLRDESKLSTSELAMLLGREDNDLHYYIRKLKRSGLIRNRRDPNTGTEETYSYYELTDMGHVVLTDGIAAGVQKLACEEATIADNYTK